MPDNQYRQHQISSEYYQESGGITFKGLTFEPVTENTTKSLILIRQIGPQAAFEHIDDIDFSLAGIAPGQPSKRGIMSNLRSSRCRSYAEESGNDAVSSVTKAGTTPPAMLRRLMHRIENQSVTQRAIRKIEAHRSSAHASKSRSRSTQNVAADAEVDTRDTSRGRDPTRRLRRSGKNISAPTMHRRTHSDQPRVWKEPGAALWPLAEE